MSDRRGDPPADGEPASAPDPARPSAPAPLPRLDPDLAARAPGRPPSDRDAEPGRPPSDRDAEPDSPAPPAPVIDTRPYRWMIGIFGLVLVVAISIYQFANHGVGTTGVPPGQRLHFFAAPRADTNLVGDPNVNPPCTLARHDPRALNVCLMVRRGPLVLAFFVTGSGDCLRQVDALQTLSRQFRAGSVQFAAVAVNASRATTAALVRSHRWTIPVAYDQSGAVGTLYGIALCPMVELAYRGGTVRDRLIGDHWESAAALAPRVRALLRGHPARM